MKEFDLDKISAANAGDYIVRGNGEPPAANKSSSNHMQAERISRKFRSA